MPKSGGREGPTLFSILTQGAPDPLNNLFKPATPGQDPAGGLARTERKSPGKKDRREGVAVQVERGTGCEATGPNLRREKKNGSELQSGVYKSRKEKILKGKSTRQRSPDVTLRLEKNTDGDFRQKMKGKIEMEVRSGKKTR